MPAKKHAVRVRHLSALPTLCGPQSVSIDMGQHPFLEEQRAGAKSCDCVWGTGGWWQSHVELKPTPTVPLDSLGIQIHHIGSVKRDRLGEIHWDTAGSNQGSSSSLFISRFSAYEVIIMTPTQLRVHLMFYLQLIRRNIASECTNKLMVFNPILMENMIFNLDP